MQSPGLVRSISSSILCSDVEVELSRIDQRGHGFCCYLHLCQRCCVVMGRLGRREEEGGNRVRGREGGADERLSYMHARLHNLFQVVFIPPSNKNVVYQRVCPHMYP